MRKTLTLAAAAAVVALTGCSSDTQPVTLDPSQVPTKTPAAALPPAKPAGEPLPTPEVATLGAGWRPSTAAVAPTVCDEPVLPKGEEAQVAAVTAPDGRDASVRYLRVGDPAAAVAAVRDAFQNCLSYTSSRGMELAWTSPSHTAGGLTGEVVVVDEASGTEVSGTAVAVAPVRADVLAVVTVASKGGETVGDGRLGAFADRVLGNVVGAGNGGKPSPVPDWDQVQAPTTPDTSEDDADRVDVAPGQLPDVGDEW